MNIQRKNSAHHFRMQSEREQTLDQLKTSVEGSSWNPGNIHNNNNNNNNNSLLEMLI